MKLIVGLGNPGPQYETTRHNAGFLIADLLADEYRLTYGGKKFDGEFAKGEIGNEAVVLLKPMTFMNLSGHSVGKAMQFFKIRLADVIVLHDDIDLVAGSVKARMGGGHGGHNGIRSIMAQMGSGEFHRIKLGVGRPKDSPVEAGVTNWVLGPFSDGELLSLQKEMFDAVLLRLKNILHAGEK